jgi:hypothetical protein
MTKNTRPVRLAVIGLVVTVLGILAQTAIACEPEDPGPPSGNGIPPVWKANNPDCSDLAPEGETWVELKVDPVADGTYSDGYLSTTIDEYTTAAGPMFDWFTNMGIDAIFVKGGPNGNFYQYDPPAEETADTLLHAPVNPNNDLYYGLSHISFCYDLELDVSKDANTSFTRTYEWDITKDPDDEYFMFVGESELHEYSVAVDKIDFMDSDWAVEGNIVIENNTPEDATIESVTDAISGMGAVSVDCGVSFPYVLPSNQTLTCSYDSALPNASSRTNTATVTTSGVVGGGEATADVTFGAPTTEVNASIHVDDTNGESWGPVSDDANWSYDKEFDCPTDPSLYVSGYYTATHDNTATIEETGQSDDASVTIHCYAPIVSKDAVTSFTRTYEWEITKEPNGEYWMFIGDPSTTHTYNVSVEKTGHIDSDWAVEGTITVVNPHPTEVMTVNLIDSVGVSPGDVYADLDCVGGVLAVPSGGGSATCDYHADLLDGSNRINFVTATLNGIGFNAQADVTFGDPTTEVNDEINVVDTNGQSWGPVSDDASWSYDKDFSCPTDVGLYTDGYYMFTHPNTATIVETSQSDNASVTVHCYTPVVSKTAVTSFERRYEWTIDKSADQTVLTLSAGQQFLVNYSVTVNTTGFTDSDWAVSGEITVYNPHPTSSMTVSLADTLPGATNLVLDCSGTLTVDPLSEEYCTYSADLPDGSSRINTATATLNGIDFTGTANVTFGDPTVEIDECIDVTDDNVGFLGTVCADDAPVTFPYSLYIGPYYVCGSFQHINTGSFVTNDTDTPGSDGWTVNIDVPCVGCTLTPGYWKTHSSYGPAPYDDTWVGLGEDAPFFLSGQSNYEVLWTSPRGNAYYILARAYIAAKLNVMNGADPTAAQAALDEAIVLLQTYTPDEVAAMKGKNGKETRNQFISLAGILDDYNNGYIGPGHCSE